MINPSPKEVGKQYFSLDPSRPAPVNDLYEITDALESYTSLDSDRRSRFGLIKAHSHLELSTHPGVIPAEQHDQALQAQGILTSKDGNDNFLIKGPEADRSRLFLPSFTEGWTTNLRTNVQTAMAHDIHLIKEGVNRSDIGTRKKPLYAQAVALLLDHAGLTVRPSLLRQYSSDTTAQDIPYLWDVTALSDAGEYRLRVRAQTKRGAGRQQPHRGTRWNNLHPDIVRITGSTLVNPLKDRHYQFMLLCQHLTSLDNSKTPPPNVRYALSGIVKAMQEKKPVVLSPEDTIS